VINVGIVVTERCQASSVFAVTDLIIAANYALHEYFSPNTNLFRYQLIGLKSSAKAYNGSSIGSLNRIENCDRPDIVILPGAFESVLSQEQMQDQLNKLKGLNSILQTWHQAGSILASVCTGNFILAAAGLAKKRTLSCHWASATTAQQLFPHEVFDADQLLIDHGDIVSAGGAMAISQLVLYLVGRFHSRELALATGKLMMMELNFANQSRFAMFRPNIRHGDVLVNKLQANIETSFKMELDISGFANQQGIGERQLCRRFKKATGETPLSYLQKYRVEQVKIGLESSQTPINNLIWDVGYEDPTSFRRLFKRTTGLTLQEYRARFGSVV